MDTTRYSQLEPLEIEEPSLDSTTSSFTACGDSPILSPIDREKHYGVRRSKRLSVRILYIIWHFTKRLLWFMLPSPLQDWIHRRDPNYKPHCPPVRSTTWLDGLRGIACILVMGGHWIGRYNAWMIYPYGVQGRFNHWMMLPYFRLILGTYPMVGCFFVISGYALSLKALKCARKGGKAGMTEAHSVIASGVFRRWVRLCMPAVAASLFTMFLSHYGFLDQYNFCINGGGCNQVEWKPTKMVGMGEQLADWYDNVKWVIFYPYIFSHEIRETAQMYDPHLWTIPVEFTSSMVVFLIIVGLAGVKVSIRLSLLALFTVHAMYVMHNNLMPFIFGIFLAEVDLIRDERRERNSQIALTVSNTLSSKTRKDSRWMRFVDYLQRDNWLQFALFAFGLFLFNQPLACIDQAWFFRTLWPYVPEHKSEQERQRFIPNFGVIMLMWAISNSPRLKRLFTNSLVHYLGRISFMVYILHGEWGLNVVGVWWTYRFWNIFATQDNPFPQSGVLLAYVPTVLAVIWTADIFWRAVDMPSVKLARWFEEKCKDKED